MAFISETTRNNAVEVVQLFSRSGCEAGFETHPFDVAPTPCHLGALDTSTDNL